MSLAEPAERLAHIVPSRIRVIFDRAAELEAEGAHVLHFEIGRSDFDTPRVVKHAAAVALEAGRVHYGPNAGTPELRDAIAEYLGGVSGLAYGRDHVLVSIGASEAVFLAVMAFCDPGDEVIIPVPAWPAYEAAVQLVGATPVFLALEAEDGYRLDPERVRQALTPRTRLVIVCTPHNPTGAVLDAERLIGLADTLRGSRTLVLADEIYSELVYDGVHVPVAAVSDLRERTLTVGGFAKAFAMDGWRLGWLAGPPALVAAALSVRQFTTTCPPTFLQDAAVVALRETAEERARMRDAFAERRAAALEILDGQSDFRVSGADGAFYLYLSYPEVFGPASVVASRLLEEVRIAVVPGEAFDPTGAGEHSIRISYARSVDDVREGVTRLVRHAEALAAGAR
jgi:aspartate/methionine/tyrosine aminotransferase